MKIYGKLNKMTVQYKQNIVKYLLCMDRDIINVNDLIGKKIKMVFLKTICLNCNQNVTLYRMGYCYKCYNLLPNTRLNIVRPELSTAHLGIYHRDKLWEIQNELQPHVVYLSYTSNIKVGVTKLKSLMTRLINQGAIKGVVIFVCSNRYEAGIIETDIKSNINDRTSWRKMLLNHHVSNKLLEVYKDILSFSKYSCSDFLVPEEKLNFININYPYYTSPIYKLKSINLFEENYIEDQLIGIKGQYIIFDNFVFNVNKHCGMYFYMQFL